MIFLTVVFGRNEYLLFASIGAGGWLTLARIVRGQALSIRRQALAKLKKDFSHDAALRFYENYFRAS